MLHPWRVRLSKARVGPMQQDPMRFHDWLMPAQIGGCNPHQSNADMKHLNVLISRSYELTNRTNQWILRLRYVAMLSPWS